MHKEVFHSVLISDFNPDTFSGLLNHDSSFPAVAAVAAPYGQVIAALTGADLPCWKGPCDFAVVWTQPEAVIPSYRKALKYERVLSETVLDEVKRFARLLLELRDRAACVFIPSWVLPSYHRGYGILEMKKDIGLANLLMRMNLALVDALKDTPGFYLLDSRRWMESAGRHAFSPKSWYMGKVPFGIEVFKEAVKEMKAALCCVRGLSKKLLIVDLDDVLWGGSIGEVGVAQIRLGGHDFIGEAFQDFQEALKSLKNRGVLLGISSKNEENIALEAFSHPEMILKFEDFSGRRINWLDKARNIAELAGELNVGLDSVVFIDDSPAERAWVRQALPDVFVPEWPEDVTLYKSSLLQLPFFDSAAVTYEDRERSRFYAKESERKKLKQSALSYEDWLESLKTKIRIQELHDADRQRTVQLLNKTNQMNLRTRRINEAELLRWADKPGRKIWTFRVSDQLGDSGLTGIASFEIQNGTAEIVDFILSCRVMGRGIEKAMLYFLVRQARSCGAKIVRATYIPTPKNKPCLDFLRSCGFSHENDEFFSWAVTQDYPPPSAIEFEEAQHVF